VLVEIGRLLGDAADHDAIAEHVEHQDIELARVSQNYFATLRPELAPWASWSGLATLTVC